MMRKSPMAIATIAAITVSVPAAFTAGCSSPPRIDSKAKSGTETTAPTKPSVRPSASPILSEGFEGDDATRGWFLGGSGYEVKTVVGQAHDGTACLQIAKDGSTSGSGGAFGVATYELTREATPVVGLYGKRIRLSGDIQTDGVAGGYAGLWMRVDGASGMLAFDNMNGRGVTGSAEWKRHEIVLDVPDGAKAVFLGAMLTGRGTARFDGLTVEVLGDIVDQPTVVVRGVVRAASGEAVANAMVAVMAENRDDPQARTSTGEDGRFTAVVPVGRYGFTATARGHVAAYASPRAVDDESAATAVVLTLEADGIRLSGAVTDLGGRPLPGSLVRLTRLSDDTADVFFTAADDRGRYEVSVPRANGYRLDLANKALATSLHMAKGDVDQALDLRAYERASIDAPAAPEVIDWIKRVAVPLRSAKPGGGFADMAPIAQMVGDALVVSLGEATHGTHEFFQLKHRMLEFLVETKGFNVFAIEANFPESLAVDEYVRTGEGDAAAALAGMYFWTWDTKEVLALIEWMRRYNADPKNERKRKLRFLGFDMQFTPVAATKLAEYARRVDRRWAKKLEPLLAPLEGKDSRKVYEGLDAVARDALDEGVAGILARLERKKRRYTRKSSKTEWALARQNAVVLGQAVTMYRAGNRGFAVRDQSMAKNLQWILDTQPRGTKIVSWAHNGHVSRKGYSGVQSMGFHLHQALGTDHVIFGFAFNQGSFQAIDWTKGRGKPGGLAEHTVAPPSVGHFGAAFARVGHPIFVLDMRAAPSDGPVAEWFRTPHPMRSIGSVYSGADKMSTNFVLPEEYDAIIFVDKTTRARPNPTGVRPAP